MALTLLNKAYGTAYANQRVSIRTYPSNQVARLYKAANGAVLSDTGNMVTDAAGSIAVYLDDTVDYTVTVSNRATGAVLKVDSPVELGLRQEPGEASRVVYANFTDQQDITDDLPVLAGALRPHDTLEFPVGLTLYVRQQSDLIFPPGLTLRGNGCVIKGTASAYSSPVASPVVQGEYFFLRFLGRSLPVVSTSFQVLAEAQSFTLPAGLTLPAAGDLMYLQTSNTTFGASGITRVEWLVKVLAVDGTTRIIEVDDAFSRTETVTHYTVYPEGGTGSLKLENLRVDLSSQPNSDTFIVAGLKVEGAYLPKVEGCHFLGSQYSFYGLTFQRVIHPLCERSSFANFLNTQAINGGAARVGYGLTVSRSRSGTVRHNVFSTCKHSVAQGGYGTGIISVHDNTFSDSLTYESYYEIAGVGSLVIDAHSGHDGLLDVFNNTIKTCRSAVNCRAGRLRFHNNKVHKLQGAIDTGYAIVDFFETPVSYCVIEDNEFYGLSPLDYVFTLSASVPYDNMTVHNNKIYGGSLLKGSVFSTTSCRRLTVSNNKVVGGQYLVSLSFDATSTTHVFDDVRIQENTFVATAATVSTALSLQNTSSVSTARPSVTNLKITGNTIDQTASSGNVYVSILSRLAFSNLELSRNTLIRGNVAQDFRGVYLVGCDLTRTSIDKNQIPDCDLTLENTSQAQAVWTNVNVSDNPGLFSLRFQEAGTLGFNFQGLRISRNDVRRAATASPLSFTAAAGSATWANSQPVLVDRNTVTNNSVTRTISIDVNSTGNKLVFVDNVLSRPIEDLSSTFYLSKGNVCITGTQSWKGGTAQDSSGVLRAAAAPTTGTWAVGETVWNSVPATGQPAGWICSAAPVTFKAMANLT